jgi:hypothetical protein
MDVYEWKTEYQGRKLQHQLIALLCFAGAFFVVWLSWRLISPLPMGRFRGLASMLVEAGIVSLVWASSMVFLRPRSRMEHELQVDDDSITMIIRYSSWMKWPITRKTVHKGRVRTIFEIKAFGGRASGIGISEKGRLGARMRGFVYVPETLSEFERIKCLAESWKITP